MTKRDGKRKNAAQDEVGFMEWRLGQGAGAVTWDGSAPPIVHWSENVDVEKHQLWALRHSRFFEIQRAARGLRQLREKWSRFREAEVQTEFNEEPEQVELPTIELPVSCTTKEVEKRSSAPSKKLVSKPQIEKKSAEKKAAGTGNEKQESIPDFRRKRVVLRPSVPSSGTQKTSKNRVMAVAESQSTPLENNVAPTKEAPSGGSHPVSVGRAKRTKKKGKAMISRTAQIEKMSQEHDNEVKTDDEKKVENAPVANLELDDTDTIATRRRKRPKKKIDFFDPGAPTSMRRKPSVEKKDPARKQRGRKANGTVSKRTSAAVPDDVDGKDLPASKGSQPKRKRKSSDVPSVSEKRQKKAGRKAKSVNGGPQRIAEKNPNTSRENDISMTGLMSSLSNDLFGDTLTMIANHSGDFSITSIPQSPKPMDDSFCIGRVNTSLSNRPIVPFTGLAKPSEWNRPDALINPVFLKRNKKKFQSHSSKAKKVLKVKMAKSSSRTKHNDVSRSNKATAASASQPRSRVDLNKMSTNPSPILQKLHDSRPVPKVVRDFSAVDFACAPRHKPETIQSSQVSWLADTHRVDTPIPVKSDIQQRSAPSRSPVFNRLANERESTLNPLKSPPSNVVKSVFIAPVASKAFGAPQVQSIASMSAPRFPQPRLPSTTSLLPPVRLRQAPSFPQRSTFR